jgi:hypothetical protein
MRRRRRPELVLERAVARDERLPEVGCELAARRGGEHEQEHARPSQVERDDERDRDPDQPDPAGPREIDEEPVEPAGAPRDEPVLEVPLPGHAPTFGR